MGILTRVQDDCFVITSDRTSQAPSSKRAPRHLSGPYQVWTGVSWSADAADAMSFASLDDADEYVRANYRAVSA
jgi:hypothetical protein